jgi:branched-chain amino acid transport system substrate-binding protein
MFFTGEPGRRAGRVRSPRLLSAALLSGAVLAAGCRGGGAEGTLVLGLAIPLTDEDGAEDIYGTQSLRGAEMAVEEINASGLLRGRPLRLRVVNDRGSPNQAPVVADSLAADPEVLAVVGHVYSGASIKAAPSYEGRVAAVATTATNPEVARQGRWIFRVASSDAANAADLARAAMAEGGRIGVLYANGDYGRGLAFPFVEALRAGGGSALHVDPFLDETPDFRPYLRRMQRSGVDLVFLAGLQDPGARAIAQAQDLGFGARFIGGDGLEGLMRMGARYDGTGVGLLFHPEMSDSARAFSARFHARFGVEADGQAALAYDAVRLLATAIAAGNQDRASIRDHLARVGRPGGVPAFEGIAGRVEFDENGDPVNKPFILGIIQNGGLVLPGGGR